MTYIEKIEAELLKKLNGTEDATVIVRWVSEKILESYRNGITAGQKGAQVIRKARVADAGSHQLPSRELELSIKRKSHDAT